MCDADVCMISYIVFCFFKQKTAYEMRMCDWSSDVCSSELSLDTSAQLVIQTVMGGAGTLLGPLLGATIWLYLYEGLQQLSGVGAYWKLILGIVFVVLVTVFRHGVAGGVLEIGRASCRERVCQYV